MTPYEEKLRRLFTKPAPPLAELLRDGRELQQRVRLVGTPAWEALDVPEDTVPGE